MTRIGTIPSWLSGRFFRSGPGIYEVGDTKFNHWFDGLALLMSFNIMNGRINGNVVELLCFMPRTGKATFQSRYLKSQIFQKIMAANRIVVSGFGTAAYPDPCKTIFQRSLSHSLISLSSYTS